MDKHYFRYQILRYIPDLRRMEPENFGIIVQGPKNISCRFHVHIGGRKDFDFDNYRRWREFFESEIFGPAVPIFQPKRNSLEFLEYLQKRCSGNYSLTRPLELALNTDSLKEAENYLFETLVLKPDEKETRIKQPVQRFKSELEKREILKHAAFKRKELFRANGLTELVEYHYIRNHGSDTPVLIQPVQVLSDISRTINALERAEALVTTIREAKVRSEVCIVIDVMEAPDQRDSDTKKWAYDRIQKGKEEIAQLDTRVVDSTSETVRLAANIEKDLSEIETSVPQTIMSY